MIKIKVNKQQDSKLKDLIKLFVDYRQSIAKNPTDNKTKVPFLKDEIEKMFPDKNIKSILMSVQGKIDSQLFSFILNALKTDPRTQMGSDKLDNYEMSVSPEQEKALQIYNPTNPDPGWMKVRHSVEPYKQDDLRKFRKS
jgi:hypothetical protein